MNQKTKELWVIPIVVALATGIPISAVFMFLTAWLTGVPIHNPLSLGWIRPALAAQLPVWMTLLIIAVAAILAGLNIRQRARTEEERAQKASLRLRAESAEQELDKARANHTAEIKKLKQSGPKLHGVWNPAQTLWHMGSSGGKPAMQIGGWISLSTLGTDEIIYLLAAYIGDRQAAMRIDTEVAPHVVQECQIMTFFVPPLEDDPTKPFTATIIVEDHQNRRFELPRTTFRATPPPSQVPHVAQPSST